MLALQRTVGNRAVAQLLAAAPVHPLGDDFRGGIVQRYTLHGPVSGDSPAAARAWGYRLSEDDWNWHKNVGTIAFVTGDGSNYDDAVISGAGHAEKRLLERRNHPLGITTALLAGRGPGNNVELYTELEPCPACATLLTTHLPRPADTVFYSARTNLEHRALLADWKGDEDTWTNAALSVGNEQDQAGPSAAAAFLSGSASADD